MRMHSKHMFSDTPEHIDRSVNPYLAMLEEGIKSKTLPSYCGSDLKDKKGSWHKETFVPTESAPLVVEIGCHKGLTLESMAKACPDTGFLGLDITYKRVVLAAKKCLQSDLTNVGTAMADARHLNLLFGPQEVSGVVVFYPDPWNKKKRQIHNRLLNREFFSQLATIIKPGGFFWFKTDVQDYFQEVCQFADLEFTHTDQNSLDELSNNTYTSTFERQFNEAGLPSYGGIWRR